MTNNEDYANLLELYAKIIRNSDYKLSRDQKEMIKYLGEMLLEKNDIKSDIIHYKKNSKKILKMSEFEQTKRNKKNLEKNNTKLAKDIGKEPGE